MAGSARLPFSPAPLLLLLAIAACGAHGTPSHVDAGKEDAGKDDGGVADDAGCPTNFHDCGGACRFNNDPSNCGSLCTPCPTPDNGEATCDGQSCGFTCRSDYHACGSSCVLMDGDSCGSSCMQCPGAVNATAFCSQTGTCGLACNGTFITCPDGACGQPLWATTLCGANADCCDGQCGANGYCCASPGAVCQQDSDCVNNVCPGSMSMKCAADGGTGVCCYGGGAACNGDSDCCSGNCTDGNCAGG